VTFKFALQMCKDIRLPLQKGGMIVTYEDTQRIFRRILFIILVVLFIEELSLVLIYETQ
jgi:hypothetical protein